MTCNTQRNAVRTGIDRLSEHTVTTCVTCRASIDEDSLLCDECYEDGQELAPPVGYTTVLVGPADDCTIVIRHLNDHHTYERNRSNRVR